MKKKTGILELNRNQIGSISLKDIDNFDKMLVNDRKNYAQQAESVWSNPVFQNEIKVIIQAQLEYMGMEAECFEKILVSRGTINGIDLIRERFQTLHNEFIEAVKPKEKFDRFGMTTEDD